MSVVLHWFRKDIRLSDNPSLCYAAEKGDVLPVFIYDNVNMVKKEVGEASRVWLHYALQSLNRQLNGKLKVFIGNPKIIIPDLIKVTEATSVCWNRRYEPFGTDVDKNLKEVLEGEGTQVKTFKASLLLEPWEGLKDNGEPYRVFTPFYKKSYFNKDFGEPLKEPSELKLSDINNLGEIDIDSLNLLPENKWYESLVENWDISENGAKEKLFKFLDNGVKDYKKGRNFPAKDNNSRLSPYLHFGQISPRQIWYSSRFYEMDENIENFCVEIAWREFSNNLLYHFPELPHSNLQKKFDKFPWVRDDDLLRKWQKGMTGYPIVDAGMRELWQTGFMHNRVRMVVASFLVKNLLIDWRCGEEWFWDCLFDADLANNCAGWQWVAGCGADAAPYFRVFNPVTQGERFDENGEYTKKYIPELAKMPKKYLFKPWEAPSDILMQSGVELGRDYPYPVVDVAKTRKKALHAYDLIK